MSSIRDVALSDHYCIEFSASVPMPQVNAELTVKKRHLTPEVAESFIMHVNMLPLQTLPSSVHSLVNEYNTKLRTTIDLVVPLKLKKTCFKM